MQLAAASKDEVEKKFDIKTSIVGPAADDAKELKVLNRLVRCTRDGYEYGADPRHAEMIMAEMRRTFTDQSLVPRSIELDWFLWQAGEKRRNRFTPRSSTPTANAVAMLTTHSG